MSRQASFAVQTSYLASQQAFAAEHPWFSVLRLDGRSHVPSLEVPEADG
jgi:hypothetical protein